MVVEFEVQSTSDLDTKYKIQVYPGYNYVECSCKGFQIRKRCSHIRFYKKLIKEILK